MFTNSSLIRLNITHSHTKTILAEQRFYSYSKIYELKSHLSKKYGTLPEYMKLKLIKNSNSNSNTLTKNNTIVLEDEEKSLEEYNVNDYDTIHVIDTNPNSVMVINNFDDVSTVKKYEISEEDYDKRDNTVRKFRQNLEKNSDYVEMIKKNKGETYEEQAKSFEIGKRCLLGDGTRRGEIAYIGKVPTLEHGYFIGVKLDEPSGDCDGTVGGKEYFKCEHQFGVFVRPDFVKMGDFPPEDIFNEEEDEI